MIAKESYIDQYRDMLTVFMMVFMSLLASILGGLIVTLLQSGVISNQIGIDLLIFVTGCVAVLSTFLAMFYFFEILDYHHKKRAMHLIND